MWACLTTAQLILESPGSTWPILSLSHPVDWSLITKRSTRLSSCSSEINEKPILHNTTFQEAFELFLSKWNPTIFVAEGKIKIRNKLFREEERVFIQTLYPGRIGIWRCCFLWGEENWRTRRKTLGARREPTTNSSPGQTGGRRRLSPQRHPRSPRTTSDIEIELRRPLGWSQNTLQGLCSLMSRVASILHAKDIYFPLFHSVLRSGTDKR